VGWAHDLAGCGSAPGSTWRDRTITELSQRVAAPGPDAAVAPDRTAYADGNNAVEEAPVCIDHRTRNVDARIRGERALPELAEVVVPPGPDRAIDFERRAPVAGLAEGNDAGEGGNQGWSRPVCERAVGQLAMGVAPPGPDGAIGRERQGVADAGPNRDDAGQAGDPSRRAAIGERAVAQLAGVVIPPGPERAIRLQGQAELADIDGHNPG